MFQACRFDAKNPSLHFEDDTAAKQAEVTDEIRALTAAALDELYRALEAERRRQAGG
jgi:hypothetical protein